MLQIDVSEAGPNDSKQVQERGRFPWAGDRNDQQAWAVKDAEMLLTLDAGVTWARSASDGSG